MVSTLDRWGHGDDIFRSLNDGHTWESVGKDSSINYGLAHWLTFKRHPAPNGPLGHWIAAVEIDPFDSNHALYTTGWGMFVTHDLTNVDHHQTVHWTPGAKGVEELVVNQVVSPSAGAAVLSAVWDVDGFRHVDLTHSPKAGTFAPSVGRNTSIAVAAKNPMVVARVYGGQKMDSNPARRTGGAYSLDNGITWKPFASHPDTAGDGTITISANGTTFLWSPADVPPCVSNDHGGHWTIAAGLPAKSIVAADRVNSQWFCGFDKATGTLYFSNDSGQHFTRGANHLPRGDADLQNVPNHAQQLWLATSGALYSSNNGGRAYTAIKSVQHARHIGFGKAAPDANYPTIYINGTIDGTYGIYRSTTAGQSWVRINDNKHQFGQISSIAGDPRRFGRVYMGSSNRGVLYGDPAR